MTLDDHSWCEFFDSIEVGDERLQATVTLAQLPLAPVRAGGAGAPPPEGGVLDGIRYDPRLNEIEVAVRGRGASGTSLRYFVSSPRSVSVEDGPRGKVIFIVDAGGVRTVVSLVSVGPGAEGTPVHAQR